MSNPTAPTVYGVGNMVSSGYPVFASKDASGNFAIPYAAYFWNGTAWQVKALVTLVSTTSILTGSATFTSSSIDVSTFDSLTGTIYSDQSGTLTIQQSFDGTNWDLQYQFAYSSTSSNAISVPVLAPNLRVVYTNGSVAQTAFRLNIGGKPL